MSDPESLNQNEIAEKTEKKNAEPLSLDDYTGARRTKALETADRGSKDAKNLLDTKQSDIQKMQLALQKNNAAKEEKTEQIQKSNTAENDVRNALLMDNVKPDYTRVERNVAKDLDAQSKNQTDQVAARTTDADDAKKAAAQESPDATKQTV